VVEEVGSAWNRFVSDLKCPARNTGREGATRLPCARNSFSWVPECSEQFRSCSERLPQPCISAGTWRSLGCARRHLRRDGALLRVLSSRGLTFVDGWSSRGGWVRGFTVADSLLNFRGHHGGSVGVCNWAPVW